jgi:hypothetical protein
MIDSDPGSAAVDHSMSRLTWKLGLSSNQVKEIRPLLEQRRERIVALLLTAPPSLTRAEFLADRAKIRDQMRARLYALLTPDQIELEQESERRT